MEIKHKKNDVKYLLIALLTVVCLSFPPLTPAQYRSVAQLLSDMTQVSIDHPNITELVDAGDSFNKVIGAGGYDILAIRITNLSITGPKPVFFVTAGAHGDERPGPELALLFIDWLTDNYGNDPDATYLVDHHEIWVLPALNPDGIGAIQRRNANNVDLNRNYAFQWSGGGVSPESEPEISALADLIRDRDLFNGQFRGPGNSDPASEETEGIYFDIHSLWHGNVFPWSWSSTPPPNNQSLSTIATKLQSYNGYPNSVQWNPNFNQAHGTAQDWVYGIFGVPAYTVENQSKNPPYSEVLNTYWPEMQGAFLYAAKIARKPYMMTFGPETLNTIVNFTGGDFIVSTVANDATSGNDQIAAVQFYINTPSWLGGTPIPMTATDGTFDSSIESAEAVIPTAGLANNTRHTIFVEAQDINGKWGPVGAAWLQIGNNNPPVIHGSSPASPIELIAFQTHHFNVSASDPDNQGLSYTWTLDGNSIGSNSPNLYYQPQEANQNPQIIQVDISDGSVTLTEQWSITVAPNPDVLIVDNKDPITTNTGTWQVSSAGGAFLDDSVYNDDGSSVFQWPVTLQNSGNYDVYVWWTYHANRSSNVPYTIHHNGQDSVVEVNMADANLGGQWNLLGNYYFNAGSGSYVQVSSINGQASADAVRIEFVDSGSGGQNQPPQITTQPPSVTITLPESAALSVDAIDPDASPSPLTYNWSMVSGPGNVDFSENNSTTANQTTGTFDSAGSYTLRISVSDGISNAAATFDVTVEPAVTPDGEIIVDNQDANTSQTGTWAPSSAPNPYNNQSVYCKNNSSTFRFDPDVIQAGIYNVYAWWTVHSNRSSNVPITVSHEGPLDVVHVNMKNNGGQWNLLGTYTFYPGGNNSIEISGINGQASADAVRLQLVEEVDVTPGNLAPQITNITPASQVTLPDDIALSVTATDPDSGPQPLSYSWSMISGPGTVTFSVNNNSSAYDTQASFSALGNYIIEVAVSDGQASTTDTVNVAVSSGNEFVIDNLDPNTTQVGNWSVSSSPNPYNNQSIYSKNTSATFRFDPNITQAGIYNVYAWWTVHSNRSSNVPITVSHEGPSDVVHVNMKNNGGQWNLLGTYTFYPGGNNSIEISGVNGQACADAVRLELVEEVDVTPGNLAPQITNITPASQVTLPDDIALTVTATDPDGGPQPLSYSWSMISGPGTVTFSVNNNSSAYDTQASFSALGNYMIEVAVSDGQASTTDTVNVTVSSGNEFVIDNLDPNTTQVGNWSISSGSNPYNNQSVYSNNANATFRFNPTISQTGTYNVYSWWTTHSNRSSNVPITVSHDGPMDVISVNMKNNGGQWNLLGTYTFSPGGNHYIEISAANGQASADAVRFELVP